jgi:L-aspartate oxidase
VVLDMTHLGAETIMKRLPSVFEIGHNFANVDITVQPIPVVPTIHYQMGGIPTNVYGQVVIPRNGKPNDILNGLYAVGETGYTGLHGANRLASNSLLECVVLGRTCATRVLADAPATPPALPPWDESLVHDADEQVVIAHNWDELRLLMWNYVGIVRTTRRLERALHRIELLRGEIDDYYANFRVTRDLLELRNLVDCAELIVRSARMRHESRGLHFSRDFPQTLPVSFPTVLTRPARSAEHRVPVRPLA